MDSHDICRHNYTWREDWSSASVVNHIIVTDPTNRHPGFNLPRHTWSLLNRFWTGQGPCRANLCKWGLTQSPSCDCSQCQTMNHIVDTRPLTKFEGRLNLLHEGDDDAVIWLESTPCLKKPDMPIVYHNSSKNRRLSIIFDLINRSSMLDNLTLKLLI